MVELIQYCGIDGRLYAGRFRVVHPPPVPERHMARRLLRILGRNKDDGELESYLKAQEDIFIRRSRYDLVFDRIRSIDDATLRSYGRVSADLADLFCEDGVVIGIRESTIYDAARHIADQFRNQNPQLNPASLAYLEIPSVVHPPWTNRICGVLLPSVINLTGYSVCS